MDPWSERRKRLSGRVMRKVQCRCAMHKYGPAGMARFVWRRPARCLPEAVPHMPLIDRGKKNCCHFVSTLFMLRYIQQYNSSSNSSTYRSCWYYCTTVVRTRPRLQYSFNTRHTRGTRAVSGILAATYAYRHLPPPMLCTLLSSPSLFIAIAQMPTD